MKSLCPLRGFAVTIFLRQCTDFRQYGLVFFIIQIVEDAPKIANISRCPPQVIYDRSGCNNNGISQANIRFSSQLNSLSQLFRRLFASL